MRVRNKIVTLIFLDAQNGTGTMEFSIHGIPDDFFPVQVIKKIFYQIQKKKR